MSESLTPSVEWVVVVIPHHWGAGETPRIAWNNVMAQYGIPEDEAAKWSVASCKEHWPHHSTMTFSATSDEVRFSIDDFGRMRWNPDVFIERIDGKR